MHRNGKLGLAALSLGAAAATIGALPVSAQEECVTKCEPSSPAQAAYFSKIAPTLTDVMLKFGENSEIFHKIDTVLHKIEDVLYKIQTPTITVD